MFEVCYFEPDASGNGGFDVFTGSCRPIVCNTDDDCPYAAFGDDIVYACRNGLCESHEALLGDDAMVMCLSAAPRLATCDIFATENTPAIQQIVADVSASCPAGGTCNVPADCRQP